MFLLLIYNLIPPSNQSLCQFYLKAVLLGFRSLRFLTEERIVTLCDKTTELFLVQAFFGTDFFMGFEQNGQKIILINHRNSIFGYL
jgi:hypothetical protein